MVCAIILSSCPSLVHGWGFEAHRMISERAIKSLPSKLQPFYLRHEDAFDQLSVYPDIRRFNNDDEAPRHYVDLERLPGDTIPHAFEDAVDHYGWETLEHAGYVPWQVQKVYGQLVEAFKNRKYREALLKSGTLSHYLADAHVPLHTTENYDGQLSGDTGVHARFESDLIELFPGVIKDRYEPAGYIGNVPWRTIEIVRTSHELVPDVLEGDRRNQYLDREQDGYSFVKARDNHGDLASRRLNDASHMVASFWYSAWVDAGRPDMPSARFSDFIDREERTTRSVTYYQGEWTGHRNWEGADWDDELEKIRVLLEKQFDVRLAVVEISEEDEGEQEAEVEILEAKNTDSQQLQKELTRVLQPVKVDVDTSN